MPSVGDKPESLDDAFHEDGATGSTPAGKTKAKAGKRKTAKAKSSATKSSTTAAPKKAKTAKRKARVKKAPAAEPEDNDDIQEEEDSPNVTAELGDDVVVDVGSLPTLPSLPSSTGSSVPAKRAKDGVRSSALDAFLQEMGRYPVLSTEEERELTLQYYENQDPSAARKLVVHNLRLVVKMAYKYRRAWASVLDLIQEGNVGLVEAVQRFDPFKGAKFSTYATFWIRAYMLRYLLEHSRTVRISRTRVGRKLFFQLAKERAKLRAQGIDPGPKLLAERLGVKEEDLEEVVRHMDQPEIRLDAPAHSDDTQGSTILDTMSTQGASPEAEAFRRAF
ncbi:MAG: sigma-70 family RNA polymerase sigma factor, partial [Myxococcota bacterium]